MSNPGSISHACIELWVQCPICQKQLNEVTNRESMEPVFTALKSGSNVSVMECPGCKNHFGVAITNL